MDKLAELKLILARSVGEMDCLEAVGDTDPELHDLRRAYVRLAWMTISLIETIDDEGEEWKR